MPTCSFDSSSFAPCAAILLVSACSLPLVAFLPLFPAVSLLVNLQVAALCEPLLARRAHKGLFAAMRALVNLQEAASCEALLTRGA